MFHKEKGVLDDSIADKNKQITDYLVGLKDSNLSEEEIRWQLQEKLDEVV